MKKIEYKVVALKGDDRDVEELEKWAEEGWDLVTAFPTELIRGHMKISAVMGYLKREREA